jgi:hypothetical protein
VDVVFVHGDEEVFSAILSADRKATREVGEIGVAAEVGRVAYSASEYSIGSFVWGIVVKVFRVFGGKGPVGSFSGE